MIDWYKPDGELFVVEWSPYGRWCVRVNSVPLPWEDRFDYWGRTTPVKLPLLESHREYLPFFKSVQEANEAILALIRTNRVQSCVVGLLFERGHMYYVARTLHPTLWLKKEIHSLRDLRKLKLWKMIHRENEVFDPSTYLWSYPKSLDSQWDVPSTRETSHGISISTGFETSGVVKEEDAFSIPHIFERMYGLKHGSLPSLSVRNVEG